MCDNLMHACIRLVPIVVIVVDLYFRVIHQYVIRTWFSDRDYIYVNYRVFSEQHNIFSSRLYCMKLFVF